MTTLAPEWPYNFNIIVQRLKWEDTLLKVLLIIKIAYYAFMIR